MTITVAQIRVFAAVIPLTAVTTMTRVAHAQASRPRSAEAALRAEVDLDWKNVRLRESLTRLAAATDLPLLVDRRVDPELRASLSVRGAPLARVFATATAAHGLGYSTLGPIVYVGPARSVAALRHVGPRGRLPRAFRRLTPLEWPRRTEPRDLILRSMPRLGPLLENPEAIPHDLWPAGGLPKMSRGDQLTLLLIGFDQTWAPVAGERSGSWRVTPIDYTALPRQSGRPEARSPEARSGGGEPGTADRRYTLRVKNQSLRAVLEQIAERVGLRLVIDSSAAGVMENEVSFAVEGATLEALVRSAASAAGLNAEVSEKRILVTK